MLGPHPLSALEYGQEAKQIATAEEHPAALMILIRSPKSCVRSFMYAPSPQPPHAPENSKRGRSSWLPFMLETGA